MLVTESRPRTLKWFHAGPLLYGDWGTSRLYVLGLAFLYTAHASVIYLAAIGVLMIAVSWAYTIICRSFPDGGGVYTAARQLSPTLSVVGATLLLSGYIMTAAISVIEAFHYFGVTGRYVLVLSVLSIVLIGGINWLGAKSAGQFAMIIAFAALAVSAVMGVLTTPYFLSGLKTIEFGYFRETSPGHAWVNFTKICLALAGVEAVANMTGIMKHPVSREAKRTIWPVAAEVVGLNMWFGLALAGLGFVVAGTALNQMHVPDDVRLRESREAFIETLPPELAASFDSSRTIVLDDTALVALDPAAAEVYKELRDHEERVEEYTNASMKVIAREAGTRFLDSERAGLIFSKVAGVTFGLLLLSATNTAVMAMVSVLFAMAQDRELPRGLTKLNYSGVPWVALIASVLIPIAVIAVEQDVTVLAELYVLGVCGAITVTVGSCALNKHLEIPKVSRAGMLALASFLLAITLTIGLTQWVSTAFSGTLVAAALTSRAVLARRAKGVPSLPEPITGWLAEVKERKFQIDPAKPRIMLAARGRYQSEYAVDLAKRRGATLFAIYVRTLRVMDVQPGRVPRIDDDPDAQQALGTTALIANQAGVPFVPIYVTSSDITGEILDYTVTYGCDTLIMGKSKRSAVSRKLEGDVVTQVESALPDGVTLIARSAETPHRVPTPPPPADPPPSDPASPESDAA
ncbi:MAG: universal stress protein [Phycisphaerales bacterium]